MANVRFRSEIPRVFKPLLKPARLKGAYGGRGSAKSWHFADRCIEKMLSGKTGVGIREVQKSIADSSKLLIENRIEENGLADLFGSVDSEIRCKTGSRMIFRGMSTTTQDSIKSLEGFDFAWCEEAQNLSQRSLDLLIPTIRKAGSEIMFSWNPMHNTDPVDVLLRQNPPHYATVVEANYTDNPFFPDVLRMEMEREKERNPDKYAHIWLGAYENAAEARIFNNMREGELTVPRNVIWFYGVDWGFSRDPNAGVRCCIPQPGVMYIDHEFYEHETPTERLPALIDRLPGARDAMIRADSARPETIDYVKRHGFPKIFAARKGPGSIEDGINFIQGYDVVIHPRCVNTINEFLKYAYRREKKTDLVMRKPEDANNHCIDALRMACEGLHRKGVSIIDQPNEPDPIRDYGGDDWGDAETNWKVL